MLIDDFLQSKQANRWLKIAMEQLLDIALDARPSEDDDEIADKKTINRATAFLVQLYEEMPELPAPSVVADVVQANISIVFLRDDFRIEFIVLNDSQDILCFASNGTNTEEISDVEELRRTLPKLSA
jgi:hypothetical protein